MTRHQRRKAAKARWEAKAERLATAHKAWETQRIVSANLANPIRPSRTIKGLGNRGVYKGVTAATARGSQGKRALFDTPNEQLGKPGKARAPRAHSVHCPTVFQGLDGADLSGKALRQRAKEERLAREAKARETQPKSTRLLPWMIKG